MSWQQITFIVDSELVPAVTDILETFLAQAVTSENAGADEFYEVAFPGKPDWEKVAVTGLFQEDIDPEPIVTFVRSQIGKKTTEIPTEIKLLKDQNWERVWLESFKPIRVGERLWVCPSWCDPIAPDERNIILDPGLAFGTGTHPTTHLCLQWLATQHLQGQSVLDYGAGSGILAIAALLSGANHAVAVDIDPLAVDAARENAERNGVASQLDAYLPNALPEGHHQLVIANILAEVIVELRDTLLLHLTPGGRLVLTGILSTQVDRVMAVYSDHLDFQIQQQEQWSMLVGQHRSS